MSSIVSHVKGNCFEKGIQVTNVQCIIIPVVRSASSDFGEQFCNIKRLFKKKYFQDHMNWITETEVNFRSLYLIINGIRL